jgi:threonine dehydrogenase-like Zn-dependent dehydrogenase
MSEAALRAGADPRAGGGDAHPRGRWLACCGHTPAGPIGLLAALIGRLRGLEVHVLDRVTTGQKPDLVKTLGATYHSGAMADLGFAPDIIIECTGVGQVISDCFRHIGAGGVICLTGLGSGGSASGVVADVASEIVLKNNVVVGSVNANKRHWYKAAQDLARADREWLARLVSRRVRPEDFSRAFERSSDDVKVVLDFAQI